MGRFVIQIGRGKALIVDDDSAICRLLCQRLAAEAFYCVAATSGEQALQEIRKQNFSVILLDMMLPGISGLDVLRNLDSTQPEACTLVVSGYEKLATAVEAMKLGVRDFISKPFDLTDIVMRVDNALRLQKVFLEKRAREITLEEKIYRQGEEARELATQTVQSLVRQYLLEQQLSEKGPGKRRKINLKEFASGILQQRRGTNP